MTRDNISEVQSVPSPRSDLGFGPAGAPRIARVNFELADGGIISGLKWGKDEPRVVLLHGGGQNAHTWDAVAQVLDQPALALDLPGHGYSSWRSDRDYRPWSNAETIAPVLERLAPQAEVVVGMSLGGLTAIRLRKLRPELVTQLVLVDVTPSAGLRTRALTRRARGTISLLDQERFFSSLDEMVSAALRSAGRDDSATMRRGVEYNAKKLEDGRWTWRYDQLDRVTGRSHEFVSLWSDLSAGSGPVSLAVATHAGIVLPDDEDEFIRSVPGGIVRHFDTANHSVQSAYPVELANFVLECTQLNEGR